MCNFLRIFKHLPSSIWGAWGLLLPLIIVPFSTRAGFSEFGLKGGYQLYNNDLGRPSTFGKGMFINTPLVESLSLEGGLLLLGEAEESNHYIGAFNVAEISTLYHYELPYDKKLFAKAGIAPWFGYLTLPNGEQAYDYGVSPILGVGYSFPLYGSVYGRLEYQYLHNLGGDSVGYTDSHFLSLGVSWRSANGALLHKKEMDTETSNSLPVLSSSDELMKPSAQLDTGKHATILSPDLESRSIYGSWWFDTNSSALYVPKPFQVLDAARKMVVKGCELNGIEVQGYADSVRGVWL